MIAHQNITTTMTALERIKQFLNEVPSISLGYTEIAFFSPDKLAKEQIGYSIDDNKKSLVTGREGDWKKEWLVIGRDGLGDPIIVDQSEANLSVWTAMHGEGEWDPSLIAGSLEAFKKILLNLEHLSKQRTNPADLAKNPISKKDQKQFIKEIKESNPEADIYYWSGIFE